MRRGEVRCGAARRSGAGQVRAQGAVPIINDNVDFASA